MRITNGMLVNNMMNNLNSNLNRMGKYQNQGASGRRFDKPSDDPIGMSRSLKLYTDISKVGQYERNLNDANSWMHTTEEALKELEQVLQRTRELSVDAANGTKTEEDTKNIAEEIKQLKEQAIKLGNTRHAGRSIFTGFKTDQDLFKANGTYNIDVNLRDISNYNVGIAEDMDINIVGSRIFSMKSDEQLLSDNLKLADGELITDVTKTVDRKKRNLEVIKDKLIEAVRNEEGIDPTIKIEDIIDTSKDIADVGITQDQRDKVIAGVNQIDLIVSYDDLPINSDASPNTIKDIKNNLGIKGGSDKADDLWLSLLKSDGELTTEVNETSSMMSMFDKVITAMEKGDYEQVSNHLKEIDKEHENIVSIKAEIGAKTNRLDMTEKRLSSEKLNFKSNLSKNEDVDYAELIMKTKLAETVYQASLSISGRIIQPTLMDFLR